MAGGTADASPGSSDTTDEVREARSAALDLGEALQAFGTSRLSDVGKEVSDKAAAVAREGRRLVHYVEQRFGQIEERAGKSQRQHPGTWAAALPGVIGFGLVPPLVLRRRE